MGTRSSILGGAIPSVNNPNHKQETPARLPLKSQGHRPLAESMGLAEMTGQGSYTRGPPLLRHKFAQTTTLQHRTSYGRRRRRRLLEELTGPLCEFVGSTRPNPVTSVHLELRRVG